MSYDPPEERIAALVAKHTPRQLAIAYLRAVHRARQGDLAFRTLADVADAESALRKGEGFEQIAEPLERAIRRFGREF